MSKRAFKNKKNIVKTTEFYKGTSKWLIIVESPSKCSKIEYFLGTDYKCIASKGHIRSIEGLKSIDKKNNYNPLFSIIPEKSGHIDVMRKIIDLYPKDKIILASDDDREGEAIAWHICELFDIPININNRIVFHEITKNAVLSAISNPIKINMGLVYAQHARQVLDILVGFKISPVLWKYLYNNKDNSLSAGRCQTPALRLVYDNEMKKRNGTGIEMKYKVTGKFFSHNLDFDLSTDFLKKEQALEFLEKSKNHEHMLTLGSQKESYKSPPQPFNTSDLLQIASNVLHLSPTETMKYCQILYQDGEITYMRTESKKYSSKFLDESKKYITSQWGDEYIGELETIENKNENNPHEAIRVTHIDKNELYNAEGKLAALYKLIWKNTVESCMPKAKYHVYEAKITAPNKLFYKKNVEIPIFLGWRKVLEKNSETVSDKQNNENGLLFFLQTIIKSQKPVNYNSIECILSFYNKHSHYTEASLIKELEDIGIGRPSTYAMLVHTIQERGYVKRTDIEGEKHTCIDYVLSSKGIQEMKKEKIAGNEKNKLLIQSTGIIVAEFLTKNFEELFSYDYTKTMEHKLDIISNNSTENIVKWYDLCKECETTIKKLLEPVSKISKTAYKIDDTHDLIFVKFGPAIRNTLSDGNIEYKSVKKDFNIDLEKMKNGEYTLSDLMESEERLLGKYEGEDIYLKTGRYGNYVEWGKNKKNIDEIKKPFSEITLNDVLQDSEKKTSKPTSNKIIRVLNDEFSVREGKYGPYVFYQPAGSPKPKFLDIKKFRFGFTTCEIDVLLNWLCETYNINQT